MPKTATKSAEKTEKKVKKVVAPKTAKATAKKAPKVAGKANFEDASTPIKETKKPTTSAKEAAPKVESRNYFYGYGKRKTSGASVRLIVDGKGSITINNRTFENYFPVGTDQDKILAPLRLTNNLKNFDISVMTKGGGVHSQAEAIRHGIAKALLACDVAFRAALKSAGFITRDSRIKERKKYGLKRARRAPQWQKR